MIYKIINSEATSRQIYGRVDDDGKIRLTCNANYPPFKEWLAEGNEPEPADQQPFSGNCGSVGITAGKAGCLKFFFLCC